MTTFAETIDGTLVELRAELLREARHLLAEFEQHRDAEDAGRLLATLEHLALLVRA